MGTELVSWEMFEVGAGELVSSGLRLGFGSSSGGRHFLVGLGVVLGKGKPLLVGVGIINRETLPLTILLGFLISVCPFLQICCLLEANPRRVPQRRQTYPQNPENRVGGLLDPWVQQLLQQAGPGPILGTPGPLNKHI